jgi:hypothetical protein
MSVKYARNRRWPVLAMFGIGLVLIIQSTVPAGDLDKVAAQKAIVDIKARIAEARRLESTNPEKAKEQLRLAEFDLEDAKTLTANQRADLDRQIQAGLKRIAERGREREVQSKEDAQKQAVKDRQDIRKREFEEKGKATSGVGQIKDFINTGKGALLSAAELKKLRENGYLKMEEEKARTFAGMVEERFTKHYLWVLEHGMTGQKLSPEEKELIRVLNMPVSVDFKNHTLKQVLEYFTDKTQGQLKINVDELSLKEVDVEYDTTVTYQAKKTTIQNALKMILNNLRLTYIIKEAALHVMTPAKARDYLVVRVYPIADLLGTGDPRFGPFMNQLQKEQAAYVVMQIILNNIDPSSWKVNGGRGDIVFDPVRMALIITNSAEWHYQMTGAFFK